MKRIEDLTVGQHVIYVQDTGYGLRHDWPAVILKITAKRVTIKLDGWPNWKPMSVSPDSIRYGPEAVGELMQGEPPEDWPED